MASLCRSGRIRCVSGPSSSSRTAREDGVALTGEGGLLTEMMRHVLQTGLEVEMAEHLGYGPHERPAAAAAIPQRRLRQDRDDRDRRGRVRMPRDRQGTFTPVTVPKYQRRLDGLSGNVISLYAKGLTTGYIEQHLPRSTAPRCRGRRSRRSPTRSSTS